MAKQLRVMEWNANGLLQHQQELQVILELEKIDVCLIAETHFTKESFIRFRGYKTYHTIHPDNAAKGGTAVIVRESIAHYQEMSYQTAEIQATAISIKTHNCNITLVAVYCPPKYTLGTVQYLDFLNTQGQKFIIGGDYNSKHIHWGSRLTTTKGKNLLAACRQLNCETLSTGKPTYWPTDPNKIPDLIDFFIVKNISTNYLLIEEGWDMNSDHSPILLTLSDNIIKKENPPRLTNKWTDWPNFRLDLENCINLFVPLKTKEQLDEEVETVTKNIQQAAWKNTPEIPIRTRGNNYPKEIRILINEKRKLRRKWHQTRNPADKTALNNRSQNIRREIQRIKNEAIGEFLTELTADKNTDYSLWKSTKRLKRPILQNPPIRNSDGTWARNNMQKAMRFAEHLESTFQPNDGDENPDWEEPMQINLNITPTTKKEVSEVIHSEINPKKAPGFDLITGEILKQLPEKAIRKLTHLINASFRLRYVPQMWKVAEVTMISKPGKPPNEATSYRPISLLPVISKLYEKILTKRIKSIIEEKNLIPNHQFGFRESHSTIDQVHRIVNIIEKTYEEKKVCSAIFLDVAQAFDRVWHKGLFHKLRKLLPTQFSQLLESYLTDRYFRTKQEEAYSDLRHIKAGVPQGSVLGPILYVLYTSDIPPLEQNTIATFADDTAILAVGNTHEEATEKLQSAVGQISTWTRTWRIKLNEAKSVHVNFTTKKAQNLPVRVNDTQIPIENVAKYLGIHLDARLRWKVHVKKKREELGLRYKKMYWLLGRGSQLSISNKILLYKQILKPVWLYGAQLWGCTSKSNLQIIQRYQNKVLRGIVDAPWYIRNSDLHRDLKMDTVEQAISNAATKHEQRLHHHTNIEAIQLLDNTDITRRLKRIKPFELVKW